MKKKLILSLVLILVLSVSASAKVSLDLSMVGSGARPMGMGRAFTAVADDTSAVFANPAGLGQQKAWGITSMTTKLMERVDYKLVGAVYPTEYGTFGAGYIAAATPAGYLTTDKDSLSTAQAVSYTSSMVYLSYGRDLNEAMHMSSTIGHLYFGANLKSVADNFNGADGSGSGSGLDLGVIFKPRNNLTTGLNLQNAVSTVNWAGGSEERLARTLNLGVAYNYDKGIASADLQLAGNSPSLLRGGVEYRPVSGLAVRVGLDQSATSQSEAATNLTAGLGIKVNGFGFDYAYRQDSTLGDNSTHYFSVSYQPDGGYRSLADLQKEPVKATNDSELMDGLYRVAKAPKTYVNAAQSDVSIMTSKPAPKSILNYYE